MTQTYKTGLIYAVIGTACFSAKSIFIKLAYQHGIGAIPLMALRMAFALPFFLVAIWVTEKNNTTRLNRRDAVAISVASIFGYYLASLLDFIGLTMIDASMERLILYTYPIFVVAISVLLGRMQLNRYLLIGVATTYSGLAMLFIAPEHTNTSILHLGGFFVLLSALSYAVFLVVAESIIPRVGAPRFNAYAMTISVVFVLTHYAVTAQMSLPELTTPVLGYALILAIVCTVIPSFLIMSGLSKIGAAHTAVLGMLGPLFTIVISLVVLNEQLTIAQWIGAGSIILGIAVISRLKQRSRN